MNLLDIDCSYLDIYNLRLLPLTTQQHAKNRHGYVIQLQYHRDMNVNTGKILKNRTFVCMDKRKLYINIRTHK